MKARVLVRIIFVVVSVITFIGDIATNIMGNYQYEKQYSSYWNLAEKASTIAVKSQYIDQYVDMLERSNLHGKYNAIFLETQDNSFDQNFQMLKSLQLRLKEIQGMDITSFPYQTAIQQITQQEQGEGGKMTGTFKSIWWKEYHFWLWDWIGITQILFFVVVCIVGIVMWCLKSDRINKNMIGFNR